MMDHEDLATETIRSDFKASRVSRELVFSNRPLSRLLQFSRYDLMFTIVEYDFKQPFFGRGNQFPILKISIRLSISISDRFQISVFVELAGSYD